MSLSIYGQLSLELPEDREEKGVLPFFYLELGGTADSHLTHTKKGVTF